jgi:alkylated DNA repair dioxygenase AlkB
VPGIELHPGFIERPDALFRMLSAELEPRQEYITFGWGTVAMPRLTRWYGDPDAVYRYSGIVNRPVPWTAALGSLRDDLNSRLGTSLNSCLVNLYSGGQDSMGWHADDEPELRDRIVSVSLGATRTFRLREGRRGPSFPVELAAGSALIMSVESQRRWQHAVPKSTSTGTRLNLTFRTVAPRT